MGELTDVYNSDLAVITRNYFKRINDIAKKYASKKTNKDAQK